MLSSVKEFVELKLKKKTKQEKKTREYLYHQ